jgi:hypothetical protein
MPERTTVRLPPSLLQRARRRAAAEGSTVTALIQEGLEKVLASDRKPKRKPAPLPVSAATGGLVAREAAVDARDRDDFEYVERMNRAG